MAWRSMTPQDLNLVKDLADRIHVNHPEDMEVFAERLRLYPQGCLALVDGGRIAGYALSHPWRMADPPPLNSSLGEIPERAGTYYIHDVALLPEVRGKGYAAQAGHLLAERARAAGLDTMSLVAVNNSQRFWERLGFRGASDSRLDAKLLSYGSDAVWMMRDLTKSA